jgi:hypothetical protein
MNALTSRLRHAADYASSAPSMAFGPDVSRLESVLTTCDLHNGDDAIICTILANSPSFPITEQEPTLTLHLLQTATITDDDISTIFGPSHHIVMDLIHHVTNVTHDQVCALLAAYSDPQMAPARSRAWLHIDRVVWRSVRRTVQNAATKPAGVDDGSWRNAKDGISDGICAVAGRHAIDANAFTVQDYLTLTGPWRAAFGQVHPEDLVA